MLSERLLSAAVGHYTKQLDHLKTADECCIPAPSAGKRYMLYMHVPFCERLCPYCSFNRFPYSEDRARSYFHSLRREMNMLNDLGYTFDSLYVGGGTPTILLDELCETIDQAREMFSINEVSCETNPNHLLPSYLQKLQGRVQRLSVGVQSFDNNLLKQMDRFEKYGSGEEILERLKEASPYFTSLNVDMIYNFPAQTEDILINDVERVIESNVSQTTFNPLMASPSVKESLARTVGKVDYNREQRFYQIICELLTGGPYHIFDQSCAWTFNRVNDCAMDKNTQGDSIKTEPQSFDMIDEYVVNYEEYPAIGSGGITYLGNSLFVNTFSLNDYDKSIDEGRMSIMGKIEFSKANQMRYRFMMRLFGLRLDKKEFKRDFGVSVERGLPMEMAFMRAVGAFEKDNKEELTLTAKGRYLAVAMMRQFFVGVNRLRDKARQSLSGVERQLLFG